MTFFVTGGGLCNHCEYDNSDGRLLRQTDDDDAAAAVDDTTITDDDDETALNDDDDGNEEYFDDDHSEQALALECSPTGKILAFDSFEDQIADGWVPEGRYKSGGQVRDFLGIFQSTKRIYKVFSLNSYC